MLIKKPKNDSRYSWTNHVFLKMMQYRISESLIRRIIRFPDRVEEGIAENTVAVMRRTDSEKKKEEIWVMYCLVNHSHGLKRNSLTKKPAFFSHLSRGNKIVVITAWRYPGKSPKRDPIPAEIMEEIKNVIF
ncbi:MAG: hypothetical protein A2390_02510 [Candidatus Liptonbacteria bacterium RIFOXYB1_FULL_36_10]|uniref:Uncharacterized protein n=3 Tax=Candidatus Liptoniibacteriota TaxID=1817909 RepID=A0A1G2CP44_9BACT|nr:MAG: hypothetical protein A2390_02510 [Candidatus Liptonbacteria bacterium RIFOXYB1_FULL_36_10]OGZ03938.1 MAG: hypothetical protein A2604_03210 [Candidatus Liptonbacteria bacterium RIFOXYD1_FULL_36_11]